MHGCKREEPFDYLRSDYEKIFSLQNAPFFFLTNPQHWLSIREEKEIPSRMLPLCEMFYWMLQNEWGETRHVFSRHTFNLTSTLTYEVAFYWISTAIDSSSHSIKQRLLPKRFSWRCQEQTGDLVNAKHVPQLSRPLLSRRTSLRGNKLSISFQLLTSRCCWFKLWEFLWQSAIVFAKVSSISFNERDSIVPEFKWEIAVRC